MTAERWQTAQFYARLARAELRMYGDTDHYRRLVIASNKADWSK